MIDPETVSPAHRKPAGGSIVVLDAPEIVDLIRDLIDSRAVSAPTQAVVIDGSSEMTFEHVVALHPSLVIVDPRYMFGRSGWELVGHIQADPRTADLPVIICTSGALNGHGSRRGSNLQILQKPFTLYDFEVAIGVLDGAGRAQVPTH